MTDLPPRQMDILILLAEGHTQPAIARQLGLSHFTIKGQLAAMYETLGARNCAHAVSIAHRCGMLALDPDIEDALALVRGSAAVGRRLALVPWEADA